MLEHHQRHPLDSLAPDEIRFAIDETRRQLIGDKEHRILAVQLVENNLHKSEIIDNEFDGGGVQFSRKILVTAYVRPDKNLLENYVDTKSGSYFSRTVTKGQPAILSDEFFEVEEIVKRSDEFKRALASRNLFDPDLVICDPWSVGRYGLPYEGPGQGADRRRLAMAVCFLKCDPRDNGYAHPIDGLIPIVDVNERRVLYVENINPDCPIPKRCFPYERDRVDPEKFRPDLKPLFISQPEGVGFTVDGTRVVWQKWSFRVAFSAREGVVLNHVTYSDRSVLYRASLCEMVVPYADPRRQHFRKNAFDVGDYGIGRCANSLVQGCDCFGEAYYFDGYMNDSAGNVVCIKNAICVHEEDNGILWKHTNWRTGSVETRRSRRLVVSLFATVANYEYGFYWYFYLDGSIEFEVKLTGVVHVGGALDGETPKYGAVISPNLYAPIHTHFFNFRLDFAVDGLRNSVYEVTVEAETDDDYNPQRNGYYANFRLLENDTDAASQLDAKRHKFWKIVNPNIKNHLGQPVAYRLEPHENAFPYAGPDASVSKRAGFIKNHFWVTPYSADENGDRVEQFAAGDYPNQHPGGDGLVDWTLRKRPIVNTDIVGWYTLGVLHLPRCEDFPVMSVGSAKFALKPDGFFDQNPSLDLPPSCKSEKLN